MRVTIRFHVYFLSAHTAKIPDFALLYNLAYHSEHLPIFVTDLTTDLRARGLKGK